MQVVWQGRGHNKQKHRSAASAFVQEHPLNSCPLRSSSECQPEIYIRTPLASGANIIHTNHPTNALYSRVETLTASCQGKTATSALLHNRNIMSTKVASFALPSGRVIQYGITEPSSASSSSAVESSTIILSNSLCSPFTSWDHVVPVLTSKGFRVLRYNQPGHSGSGVAEDLSSTTFDSLADDVRQLLAHLGISKLFAWIGVSMGAATSIVFAARYPGIVARLIPCDTISCSPVNAGTADVFAPRVASARQAGNMEAIVEGSLERWFGPSWMGDHPAETARMRQLMRETTIDGFDTCCAALSSQSFDLRPLLEDAGKGVERALLLVGEKDANLPEAMEELRRGIEAGIKISNPSASVELKVVKDAGHVCYVDGFEQFCNIITEYLAD